MMVSIHTCDDVTVMQSICVMTWQ